MEPIIIIILCITRKIHRDRSQNLVGLDCTTFPVICTCDIATRHISETRTAMVSTCIPVYIYIQPIRLPGMFGAPSLNATHAPSRRTSSKMASSCHQDDQYIT